MYQNRLDGPVFESTSGCQVGDEMDILANIMFMFKFELFRWDLATSDLPNCRLREIADFGLSQQRPFK